MGPDERRSLRCLGVVPGRFLPFHRGHEALLRYARAFCDALLIVVRGRDGDPFSLGLRRRWLGGQGEVLTIAWEPRCEPPSAADVDAFAAPIDEHLRGMAPHDRLLLFSSERSSAALARRLAATLMLFDPERRQVPISGTEIRQAPLEHWAHLTAPVRQHLALRVALIGPESTGKTTLARWLSLHYRTCWAPEALRYLLPDPAADLAFEQLGPGAEATLRAADALARECERVLFLDTELLSVIAWGDRVFGRHPAWIDQALAEQRVDLYLLTADDVPFVGRPGRDDPAGRRAFFGRCLAELQARGLPHLVLRGPWERRYLDAVAAVDALLAERSGPEAGGALPAGRPGPG